MSRLSTPLRALIALAAIGAAALPSTANAYWRGGIWFAGPIVPFYPPVVVAPPPVYYAPPPVVYAPPPQNFSVTPPGFAAATPPQPTGPSCYAGPYVCPAYQSTPPGGACSCPGNNGRVAGTVH